MEYTRFTTNEEIQEVFDGQELHTVVFKTPFTVGDAVRLNKKNPKNRIWSYGKDFSTEDIWHITQMSINVYEEETKVICELKSDKQNGFGFSDYLYDVPSTEFDVIDGTEFEDSLLTPFKVGENAWCFLNHLYDCFTPSYKLIVGHSLSISLSNKKDAPLNSSINPRVLTKRWTTERCQGGNREGFFYSSELSLTRTKYNSSYKSIGKEPQLYTIDMVLNNVDFDTFAQKTYKKDAFHDCSFGSPIYEIFVKLFDKTLEDLKEAASKESKPIKKKPASKKKKSTPKKDDKLKELVNGLSAKEIEQLKKMLG